MTFRIGHSLGVPISSGYATPYSLTKVVRPFTTITSKLPDPPKETPAIVLPGQDGEAFIAFGQAASFSVESGDAPMEDVNADNFGSGEPGGAPASAGTIDTAGSAVSAGTKTTPGVKKPQDRRPGVVSLQEIDRSVETITVYNPKDREQWVKVQRILSMRFRNMATGEILKLNLKQPPPPPKPKEDTL